MTSRSRGFTLIELMVALVVIGVLLRIAIPSYQESYKRSRRAEAKTALTGLAQALERYYTNNNTYTGAALGAGSTLYPSTVPATGGTTLYNLQLTVQAGAGIAGNDYLIKAVRTGPQAADACGNFTLTAAGLRGLEGNSKTITECWN